MTRFASLALALAAGTLCLPAAAQFQKPEDAIKFRKASFTLLAAHFGRVGAMANGRVPFDAKVAAENAALAETFSKLPWQAFGPGTEKGDTKAEAEVWSEPAKFKAASEKMMVEVAKLNAAAKTGNLDQIKAAFGAAGASCKACHDDFRQ